MVIKKRIRLGFLLSIVLLCSAIGALGWWYEMSHAVPLSSSIKNSLSFPLYYPSKLPRNFRYTDSSIKEGRVLVSTFTNKEGEHLFMSEEAKPQGFNFANFYQSILSNRKIHTIYGDAFAGTLPDNAHTMIINLVTSKTWVIINTQSRLTQTEVDQLATNIRVVK